VKAFFEENLLVRFTGDILALSPPLIVEKAQIDRIVDGLEARAVEAGLNTGRPRDRQDRRRL